ncbi:MAG: hypothetical protein A3B25_01235 [Candidatus Ryanbacteria bacterium RIFCSPLOWO2_01_FULL_48_26]|uniref:Uncharacterized protein n=1 Tax=Candidatus Ryanbacteria bacterium RIFCSPLOWO2_01_FULL_48_26 TaxID=1802126 RepID=A0A1G2GTX4_9BACT|nr:MAG: hypothetical protein A3B25_01235 [Candidatus Ryanbacteria bacterium RIFCSPLOWO2_01_FULL_48_26]
MANWILQFWQIFCSGLGIEFLQLRRLLGRSPDRSVWVLTNFNFLIHIFLFARIRKSKNWCI